MRALLLSLALLASSCAGTCSAIGGGAIGNGAIGGGAIGCGAIGGCAPVVDATPTPTPPGDPSLWFSGANIDGQNNATLANNDPVCTWVDSGSLGVDATQGTGSACPTFSAGGGPGGTRDAVVFDGGDYLRGVLVSALAQPNTIAAVASATNFGTNRTIIGSTSSSNRNNVFYHTTPQYRIYAGASGTGGGTPVAGQWDMIFATFNGSSSLIRGNGAATASGLSPGDDALGNFQIGAYVTDQFFLGPIADVLIYDTPPAAADVEAYLAAHHGVTFPVAP